MARSAVRILRAGEAEPMQRRVAGGLTAKGICAGDRVALSTSSGPEMLVAILGALRIGVVPVVLNSSLLAHERAALLADADPVAELGDGEVASLLEADPVEIAPWPLTRPMHYTSGTTGAPKGVWAGVLDERQAEAAFLDEADLWAFDGDDVHLVCSPLHHSAPIRFSATTLLRGGAVVMCGPFDAATHARVIAELSPTTTFMVPAHLQRLFALGDLPSMRGFRLLAHAGAPCPPPLKQQAIDLVGAEAVWEFYGSTEGQFTVCRSDEWLERHGTVGRARPHRRLRIDEHDQIWCEAPDWARFSYWGDPQRTAQAWNAGWFSVGDLGRLDDAGYLWLDGRRDDLVITGGVNVYPVEVEHALASVPGVVDIAVFGVDDERWGQRVVAAVVGPASEAQVRREAERLLAPYKRPKQYLALDELPRTATGKVQRSRLAERLGLEAPPPRR